MEKLTLVWRIFISLILTLHSIGWRIVARRAGVWCFYLSQLSDDVKARKFAEREKRRRAVRRATPEPKPVAQSTENLAWVPQRPLPVPEGPKRVPTIRRPAAEPEVVVPKKKVVMREVVERVVEEGRREESVLVRDGA